MTQKLSFRKNKIARQGKDLVVIIPKAYREDVLKAGLEYWEITLKKL